MPNAKDLQQQKKEAQDQIRMVHELGYKEKQLLQRQIADLTREITDLQRIKAKAQADLGRIAV